MSQIRFNPDDRVITIDLLVEFSDENSNLLIPAVLDTGASFTIISSDILVSLGYDPANPLCKRHRIITGSGVEFAPTVKVKSLTAIGHKVSNIDVLCHDMPPSSGIEGLIGLNFLRYFDLIIKFPKGIIELKKN